MLRNCVNVATNCHRAKLYKFQHGKDMGFDLKPPSIEQDPTRELTTLITLYRYQRCVPIQLMYEICQHSLHREKRVERYSESECVLCSL